MPVFNGERYIAAALESVFSQQVGDFEVVVVDDGSTDGSAQEIRRTGKNVAYLRQANSGIAAAYSNGIAVSSGRYVSFLEQDDIWLPHKLAREIAYLDAHPEAGMVYSPYYVGREDGTYEPGEVCTLSASGRCFAELFRMTLTGSTILPFSAVTVRREVIEAAMPLDSRLRISVDYSTWLKIAFRHEIGRIEEPGLIYRQHPGNTSRNGLRALQDDVLILEDWAASDEAVRILGKAAVVERLMGAYSDLLWTSERAGDEAQARACIDRMLRLRPLSASTWRQYVASHLSRDTRRKLAWYGRKLSSMVRRPSDSAAGGQQDGANR